MSANTTDRGTFVSATELAHLAHVLGSFADLASDDPAAVEAAHVLRDLIEPAQLRADVDPAERVTVPLDPDAADLHATGVVLAVLHDLASRHGIEGAAVAVDAIVARELYEHAAGDRPEGRP